MDILVGIQDLIDLANEGYISDLTLEKSIGKKNFAKLMRKQMTDKNGKIRNVWVKVGKDIVTNTHKDYKEVTEKNKLPSTVHSVGDIVSFKNSEGKRIQGKIVASQKEGVVVNGDNGIQYKLKHDAVRVQIPVNSKDEIRFLMDLNAVKPGWRNTDGFQPESCDSIEGLLDTVQKSREDFNKITDSIVEEFQGLNPLVLKRPKLKGVARIKEKLREDAKEEADRNPEKSLKIYNPKTDTYHCRTIRDCDGHTLCMNSIDDVSKVLKYLNRQPYVARCKNNFADPSPVGYSDININVKLNNGVIVELQLNTAANMVAKERYGHALYEVWRSINTKPEYKELADIMADGQKNLYKLSNKYSKEGNFPTNEIPNNNIYEENYSFKPFADSIRNSVAKAIPLFEKAKQNGILDNTTIEHFEHLVKYIG